MLMRLIGRRASDEIVKEDMKLWPFKVAAGNDDKSKIVVTYKEEKREFAGLEFVRIINEPTAAAIAYAFDKRAGVDGKMNVLVLSGTFDVSFMITDEKGIIEFKATGWNTHLGSEDFDNRMVKPTTHNEDISNINIIKALGGLRVQCKRAKRIISASVLTTS
ncbi:probable mediator of RNA polymerase II transcription subunit 37c [Tanacetum coccineum]